jgi:tol-pal system protein YbgF
MKMPYLVLFIVGTQAYAAPPPPSLDGSVYRSEPSYSSRSNTNGSYQLADNLSRLQNDLNQLKNRVEDIKQHQDMVNANVEKRLSGLSSSASSYNASPSGVPTNIPMAMHSSKTANSDASVTTLGEKERYDSAYLAFRNGNQDQAINEFSAIIAAYPKGDYADNAQYWIGEALLKKGDKDAALVAFDQVIQNYPNSSKVPDAMLKLGFTLLNDNNRAKAKEYLDYLTKNYPGTAAAGLAASKKAQVGL